MNRRSFLVGGVSAAALGGVTATYLGLQGSTELPQPMGPLHALDAVSFGVLAIFAGRVLNFEGADPVAVAHGVDSSLRYATPEARSDLGLVLGVLENALSGLVTRGQATLFSELSPEAQDEAIRRWGRSSILLLRAATAALRKLCLGVHYAPLSACAEIGYPGPQIKKSPAPQIVARAPLSSPWRPTVAPGRVGPAETENP